jgi:integrase
MNLNEATIKSLPVPEKGNKVHYFPDAMLQGMPAQRGFGVRITAAGVRSFVLNYRLDSREYRYTIGRYPDWSALRAVREARELRQRIDRGDNPIDDRKPEEPAEAPATVADVLADYLAKYARPRLRSADEYESAFRRYVLPAIGQVPILELRRGQVVRMLDGITAPVMADRCLAYFTAALNWYSIRDEDFRSPIVKGMGRTSSKERARKRFLSDDELRIVWPCLEGSLAGTVAKALLLTAARFTEVTEATWAEIEGDVWTLAPERHKTGKSAGAKIVMLSGAMVELIAAQPKRSKYVFTDTAGRCLRMDGRHKRRLDVKITAANGGAALPGWTYHDLRRTARSLMARAGVRPDVSERVLGHAIQGVEGVYDRHSYEDEKRQAVEALAGMVERIINPPGANVVAIRSAI